MTIEPDSAKDHCPASDLKDGEHSDLNEKEARAKTMPGADETTLKRLVDLAGKAPEMADIPRRRDAGD